MRIIHFEKAVDLGVSCEDAFAWHGRPGAFERLVPPWQSISVIDKQGTIHSGDELTMRMKVGPIPIKWRAVHQAYEPNKLFQDVQASGPFASWEHSHRFANSGDCHCTLTDDINYALPGGVLGYLIGKGSAEKDLKQVFNYRHAVTQNDLRLHAKFKEKPRMKIAVTGASGMVGKSLCALLTTGGHDVIRLVRQSSNSENELQWNTQDGIVDTSDFEDAQIDAVIHLAGENIGDGRWTKQRKERIRRSRVDGTTQLVESLVNMKSPPKKLLIASAIGYYGDRGDEPLDETSSAGQGFLAEVVQGWESAADRARLEGIQTIHTRLGVVLSPQGGALKQMLPPFKMGGGGPLGSGKQYMSWIALDDAISAMYFLLMSDEAEGPFNLVSPEPVTNKQFTKTLGKVLRRPTILPMPAFMVKTIFGEMGEQLLLSSARVLPRKLQIDGFEFRYPHLEDALRHVLGRSS